MNTRGASGVMLTLGWLLLTAGWIVGNPYALVLHGAAVLVLVPEAVYGYRRWRAGTTTR